MKVKLLKKVRKNFRIIENALGDQMLQERDFIFKWVNYTNQSFEIHFIDKLYEYNDCFGLLRSVLHYRYSKYTRKNKIIKQKEKQTKILWYKY
jgi:hypothetical protein